MSDYWGRLGHEEIKKRETFQLDREGTKLMRCKKKGKSIFYHWEDYKERTHHQQFSNQLKTGDLSFRNTWSQLCGECVIFSLKPSKLGHLLDVRNLSAVGYQLPSEGSK